MNPREIEPCEGCKGTIFMALEAAVERHCDKCLALVVNAIKAEERERCAKIADDHEARHEDYIETSDGDVGCGGPCFEGDAIAKKIRESGKE